MIQVDIRKRTIIMKTVRKGKMKKKRIRRKAKKMYRYIHSNIYDNSDKI